MLHRFYAKGVNCCAEVQALLDCPPVGPCRGVEANCGDLAAAFADTPVLPDYPDGLGDYACAAFPNDDNPRDSLIAGLLAFAISLPVTLFLQTCFELANDNEAPESWLVWTGLWQRVVFGPQAHRRWHYTGPAGQPVRYVKWFVRSVDAPKFETLLNLWFSFKAWVTCSLTPWAEEAAEAEAEAAAEEDTANHVDPTDGLVTMTVLSESSHGHGEASEYAVEVPPSVVSSRSAPSTSFRSAKELRLSKRKLTALGIGGVYLIWAFFSWVVFTYGMLIYKLLGPSTQDSFATSFGVSYGVGAAAEWQARRMRVVLMRSRRADRIRARRTLPRRRRRQFSSSPSWSGCTSQNRCRGSKSTSPTCRRRRCCSSTSASTSTSKPSCSQPTAPASATAEPRQRAELGSHARPLCMQHICLSQRHWRWR